MPQTHVTPFPLPAAEPVARRVRLFCYCPWASRLTFADRFLQELPGQDIAARVADSSDLRLMRMAQMDRDWHAENIRALAAMAHPAIEFLPACALGAPGLRELVSRTKPADEEWWFVLTAQHPKSLAGVIGRALGFLTRQGIRVLYYAFDEASRNLPCFTEVAPHLDALIHDEAPLADAGQSALRPDCVTIHRSWVANLLPKAASFNEQPEEKILFLGSQLGYTPHRRRQVEFLQRTFPDRMVAIHDHSVPVSDRLHLARFKVSFCPEGRMFATPGMRFTHTDRPFWSGCLGMVPVAEDSREGGRLEELHRAGLILRYAHGDLVGLARACEAALALPVAHRRRIYEHFNRHETIGAVVADALCAWGGRASLKGDTPVACPAESPDSTAFTHVASEAPAIAPAGA